jgi:RND family efflux transporter MFP subunit
VEHGVKETELCTLTLTLQAEQRLAIGLAEVIKKRMPLTRVLVGEILAVPGRSVAVLAPFPSSVISGSGAVPRPGGRVKQGQQVCELQLLMGPAERVRLAGDLANAEALVKQATARVANAQISLQRQETMLRAQATSQKALEEASLQKLVAEAELKAAQQLAVLLKGAGEMNANTTTVNLTLTSPLSGILLSLDVTPGQSLAAGSPVFTVVDMQKAWVRVPAFGSEAALVRRNTEVTISPVAARMGEPAWSAKAIEGPPTANPTTASVDLYFETDNAKALFRPHQRVSVNLVLESDAENLVVPWAAIIHDINGGQWVYEKRSPQTYARRRVEVARVAGNQAILARGPQPGTLVVTDGAAELFGTEFGGTK